MAQVDGVFAEKLQTNVRDSKVLMVGAGGIGCELLKNLVLSGRSIKIAHVLLVSLGLSQFLPISSQIKIKFASLACIATAIVLLVLLCLLKNVCKDIKNRFVCRVQGHHHH